MRIGLLSDTHIPEVAAGLPSQLKEIFQGVDLILHAGDIYNVAVLNELERIAPVLAAQGDDDYQEVICDRRVEKKHVLTFEGVTLWLTHEPLHLFSGQENLPDVMIHGHTHMHTMERKSRLLVISPGSLTFPNYRHRLGTVGLLTLKDGQAEASIVHVKSYPS